MPPRRWRVRVQDILDAIAKIETDTDAVVRNLEVIGEATRRIADDPERVASGVQWEDIAG